MLARYLNTNKQADSIEDWKGKPKPEKESRKMG